MRCSGADNCDSYFMGQEVRLFVYGTLRRGYSRHSVLIRHAVRYQGPGMMCGRLYDLGCYPGAVADAESKIAGEMYSWDDDNGALLSILDDVEGYDAQNPAASLFVRRMTDVACEDGCIRPCWVTFYNGKVESARLIPSGDYRRR